MITVKFGKVLSGKLEEYVFNEGATVEDLLEAASYELGENEKIMKKGEGIVSKDEELEDGGVYVVTTIVKGGQ
ncbi:MAG: hypothetical protein ABIM30_00070 [candidate division WOR-3 bacterium]